MFDHVSLGSSKNAKYSRQKLYKKSKCTFVFSNVLSKIVAFTKSRGKKYCRAGETTDNNTAHVHCMLDA